MKTKGPKRRRQLKPAGDGVSKALRRLGKIAAYSAPAVLTMQAEAMANGSGTTPRMPVLSTFGLAALGAGLATAGAYKLLRSKRKKTHDPTSSGSTPEK